MGQLQAPGPFTMSVEIMLGAENATPPSCKEEPILSHRGRQKPSVEPGLSPLSGRNKEGDDPLPLLGQCQKNSIITESLNKIQNCITEYKNVQFQLKIIHYTRKQKYLKLNENRQH